VQSLDIATGFDVSDADAWDAVDAVDFAFLNAGVGGSGDDLAAYRQMLGVNVDGVVFGVRRLERVMTDGGAIVATASLAGLMPMPADPIYTLTKHAVIGYVRAIAPHLTERGIRINAVCPGFVDTPIVAPELREWIAAEGIPLMQPDQVAEAVLEAARSDETGQAWVVQPGREPLRYEFRGVPGPR
jgi:NAD(P)-dependent dehydrogenase (short-subunit alcohol dehydrogenase family)